MIECNIDTSTAMRQFILKLQDVESADCTVDIGEMMKDYFNQFVPAKTGALRRSAIVVANWKQSIVVWDEDLPYAHYQYAGTVYGPNIPIFSGKKHIGWYSPHTGKYPTDRVLGQYHAVARMQNGPNKGKTFEIKGYTTPGTTHHWITAGRQDSRYIKLRRDISKYLKKRWESA